MRQEDFEFQHALIDGVADHWSELCEGISPPDLAFGPEWTDARPRPGERYFLIWDAGHILRGTKCGDGTVGLLFMSQPAQTTVRYGFGLWPLCRGLGLGHRVRDAIYDFLFSDPAIHKIESEVYSSNRHSLDALHGKHGRSVEEGRQKETIVIDGVFFDRVLYGCTRARWLETGGTEW